MRRRSFFVVVLSLVFTATVPAWLTDLAGRTGSSTSFSKTELLKRVCVDINASVARSRPKDEHN